MHKLKQILKSFELSEAEFQEIRNGIISTRQSIKGVRRDIRHINLLERDDEHIYQMSFKEEGPFSVHRTGYEIDGREVIDIDYKTDGLGAHERAHAAQSLRAGGLKFNNDGLENAAYNNLYNEAKIDKNATKNEVQAYQMQYSYDGELHFPNGIKMVHYNDITPLSISKLLNNGEALYKFAVRYNQRQNN